MKKFIRLFLLLALTVTAASACATLAESRAQREARLAKEEQVIRKILPLKRFKVDVTEMTPLRGTPKMLSSIYYVQLDGEKMISRLPYMGHAYSIPYGGGQALDFEAPIESYTYQETKNGVFDVNVQVRTDEDTYTYMFRISAGSVSLTVQCMNRDSISFFGKMSFSE